MWRKAAETAFETRPDRNKRFCSDQQNTSRGWHTSVCHRFVSMATSSADLVTSLCFDWIKCWNRNRKLLRNVLICSSSASRSPARLTRYQTPPARGGPCPYYATWSKKKNKAWPQLNSEHQLMSFRQTSLIYALLLMMLYFTYIF